MSNSSPDSRRPLGGSDRDVDLVVIGAGVNGTGVVRDAAMRGFRVALFERNDLAFGASGNSSGMIHGGVRYLHSDPAVTRASCEDSGHIQAIAPHLLFRIPFLLPVERKRGSKIMFTLMDAYFEAYDEYQPLKRGKKHTRLSPEELKQLEPGLTGDVVGGLSFDEWGIDGVRLCVENAVDGGERGARIFVGHTVDEIERDHPGGQVIGVRYTDRLTGVSGHLSTHAVVNATGAWSPITTGLSGIDGLTSLVRPGKGIHVFFDRRLTNYAISARGIDGRQVFMEPWQNMTMIGTTDDDFYGDLDNVTPTSDEVRYLIEGVAKVFPEVRHARVIGTTAGVRPTLYKFGPTEEDLSREHRIIDHRRHGARGLYSMIGGKLASYRMFAQEMVDLLVKAFKRDGACRTHSSPLPGGDETIDPFPLAERMKIDAVAARRLVYRHGSRSLRIEEMAHENPRDGFVICPCEPVIEGEVRYALRHEHARSVSDVARRTRLGFGSCGGLRCAARCGQIVSEELGLPPREGVAQALTFLRRQSQMRGPAMNPLQIQQEAVLLAATRAQLGTSAERRTENHVQRAKSGSDRREASPPPGPDEVDANQQPSSTKPSAA